MDSHRVTVIFETDDNVILNEVIRLSLALKGISRPALSVEYEVSRSEELDEANSTGPNFDPF